MYVGSVLSGRSVLCTVLSERRVRTSNLLLLLRTYYYCYYHHYSACS